MIIVDIKFISVDELFLDPQNPRLGRNFKSTSQADILERMSDWTLDELATSFVESGFWAQEALIATKEPLYGKDQLVVIEGNRRLAALKKLKDAIEGRTSERKWNEIAAGANLPKDFFDKIPYIEVADRKAVSAFLGFRHVTGIKEWEPAEKAQFISYLIEEEGLTYEQVMRKIGSKTPTVRSHYIAYKLLLQMEDASGDIAIEKIEDKFSVLYLSLRTAGVQEYLGIDIKASPKDAAHPVPRDKEENLVRYARWMFGDQKTPPLFSDSRNIDKFGKVLLSSDAVEYLEENESPNFDFALKKAGEDTDEIYSLLTQAADNLEIAFTTLHMHADKPGVEKAVKRLGSHLVHLTSMFPSVKSLVLEKVKA